DLAVKADETFPDPLVELAALALDAADCDGARALLDRAAALDDQHVAMRRERARMKAAAACAPATADAKQMLVSLAGDPAAAAYLGYLEWGATDTARSDAAFDRAMRLSDVDPRTFIAAAEPSVAAAWRAMTRYRREVAASAR